MPHETSLLQAVVVFLLAAVVVVPLAKRLQLGAVLGYLAAGVLIGPSLLGLIDDPQRVSHISELGVVLLLFIIGLELSPRRLWVMRKSVFGAGLAQVLLTALLIAGVAFWGFQQALNTALVLGLGLACELHRDWRNDIEGLGTLFSNHIPDYRNLFTSYNALTEGK